MIQDDEFISVDLMKVSHILLTETFEELHSMCINIMGSLTRRAKPAVALEVMLADVKLDAGGGEFARTVWTVALVVMWADLEGRVEGGDHIITTKTYDSSFRN